MKSQDRNLYKKEHQVLRIKFPNGKGEGKTIIFSSSGAIFVALHVLFSLLPPLMQQSGTVVQQGLFFYLFFLIVWCGYTLLRKAYCLGTFSLWEEFWIRTRSRLLFPCKYFFFSVLHKQALKRPVCNVNWNPRNTQGLFISTKMNKNWIYWDS